MKLAIVGSRSIGPEHYQLLCDAVAGLDEVPEVIVSGGARGADTLARQYAAQQEIPMIEHLPNYAQFGRGAPLVRNKLIVEDANIVLAIWDGQQLGRRVVIVQV